MSEKKPRPYKHPQINLRIPEELKEKIKKIADSYNRSMNAEIIHMLELAVDDIEPLLGIYKTTFGWDGETPLTPESFGEEPSYTFTETELNAYIENELNKFKISFFTSIQKNKDYTN